MGLFSENTMERDKGVEDLCTGVIIMIGVKFKPDKGRGWGIMGWRNKKDELEGFDGVKELL